MYYCTTYENAFEEHLWLLMGGGDLCSTAVTQCLSLNNRHHDS